LCYLLGNINTNMSELLQDLKNTRKIKLILQETVSAYKEYAGIYPSNQELIDIVNTGLGVQVVDPSYFTSLQEDVSDVHLSKISNHICESLKQTLVNTATKYGKKLQGPAQWLSGLAVRGVPGVVGSETLKGVSRGLGLSDIPYVGPAADVLAGAAGWWAGERAPGIVGVKPGKWTGHPGTFRGALGAEAGMRIAQALGVDSSLGQLASGIAGQMLADDPKGTVRLAGRALGSARNIPGVARAVPAVGRVLANPVTGTVAAGTAIGLGTAYGINRVIGGADYANRIFDLDTWNPKNWWEGVKSVASGAAKAIGGVIGMDTRDTQDRARDEQIQQAGEFHRSLQGLSPEDRAKALEKRAQERAAEEEAKKKSEIKEQTLLNEIGGVAPRPRPSGVKPRPHPSEKPSASDRGVEVPEKVETPSGIAGWVERWVGELTGRPFTPKAEHPSPTRTTPETPPTGTQQPHGRNKPAETGGVRERDFVTEPETPTDFVTAPETPTDFVTAPETPTDFVTVPDAPADRIPAPGDKPMPQTGDPVTTPAPAPPEPAPAPKPEPAPAPPKPAPAPKPEPVPVTPKAPPVTPDPGPAPKAPPVTPDPGPAPIKKPVEPVKAPQEQKKEQPVRKPKTPKPRIKTDEAKPKEPVSSSSTLSALVKQPFSDPDLPQNELYRAKKATGALVYDPNGRTYYNATTIVTEETDMEEINENKLTASESAKRKAEKQKYRVVYMQDGKKVEVFASSIRGVRRVVFGKAQFRIYDTKGSDITGYFKRMMADDSKKDE